MTFPLRDRGEAISPGVGAVVQALLGCAWGRQVSAPDDLEPCPNQATQIVVLHDGEGGERPFKLCAAHTGRVLAETDPH